MLDTGFEVKREMDRNIVRKRQRADAAEAGHKRVQLEGFSELVKFKGIYIELPHAAAVADDNLLSASEIENVIETSETSREIHTPKHCPSFG